MFKIKIITIGKSKEEWLLAAMEEYETRLSSKVLIEWVLARNEKDFLNQSEKEDRFVCLDPKGELLSSVAFSQKILSLLEQNRSRLTLLIGGAEGIEASLKKRALALLSLSPLTFTHQMTRIILLEQLFRSFEIQANSPYHK